MEWQDEALILSARPHGETAAIVELFSRHHGRYLGLVHGGRSRKLRPILQTGNHVDATWRARLSDHLGHLTVDLTRGYAAQAMTDPASLSCLTSVASLLRTMPERDPHPNLYEVTLFLLGYLDDSSVWPALYVRWELVLLDEAGFGLELESCAATGTREDLCYVSPRTGRAVSRQAGAPYADRLLRLPPFLRPGRSDGVAETDVEVGLTLTGHFLRTRLFASEADGLPEPRRRLADTLGAARRGTQ